MEAISVSLSLWWTEGEAAAIPSAAMLLGEMGASRSCMGTGNNLAVPPTPLKGDGAGLRASVRAAEGGNSVLIQSGEEEGDDRPRLLRLEW